MKRGLAGFFVALAACSLDASSKPECVTYTDCRIYGDRCAAATSTCTVDAKPTANDDLIYVHGLPSPSSPVSEVGNVLANDVDADGDAIHVLWVDSRDPNATVQLVDDTSLAVTVSAVPATVVYEITDGPSGDYGFVRVVSRSPNATIAVATRAGAAVAPAFPEVTDAAMIELVTPPAHGTLVGHDVGDELYVPTGDFCGTDVAMFRIHAANGDFDVTVTFDVALPLVGESATVEFGSPTTIDVLANDAPGIQLLSTSTPFATVSSDNKLVVDPPLDQAKVYGIVYTARDAAGHEGTATLELTVEFPTAIVVGTGLAGDSFDPALSRDGRYLAFASTDATLVAGDTNGVTDVFVRDLSTGATERVSIASDGSQANDASGSPTISGDGRYVAFVSKATNLSALDTTAVEDVYLHDRMTGTTSLVSVSVDGTGSNQASVTPQLSADGTRVVFASSATRLVANDTNGAQDIFVRDVAAGTTVRASVDTTGNQLAFACQARPRISGNGRYVALTSIGALDATGNPGTFVVDLTDLSVARASNTYGEVDIDDSGRFVLYSDSTVTLLDRSTDATTALGYGTFPVLTPDGAYPAFTTTAGVYSWHGSWPLFDVMLDRDGVVLSAAPLRRPAMSADGRWIVFATSQWPTNLGQLVLVRVWNTAYVP